MANLLKILAGHRPPEHYDPYMKRIAEALECLCHEAKNISRQLSKIAVSLERARALAITQIGAAMGTVNGIQVGSSGNFTVSTIPTGSQLQAGNVPTWSADDSLVTLTPAADGMTVNASVSASDTANTFNLTVTAISLDGSTITGTAAVPILPAAPVAATSLDINQTS